MARISKHSTSKNGKRGAELFAPDLEEWREACGMFMYKYQIAEYFDISKETMYAFLDREYYKVEQGHSSEFLDAYKKERKQTKKIIATNFLCKVQDGDLGALIFAMKSYNGVIEKKDMMLIELKKEEVEIKRKQFLTELASKFNLNAQELEKFANAYFKPMEI